MVNPDLLIKHIVGWGNFHRSSAEIHFYSSVGNYRNFAVLDWQQNFFTNQIFIALVFWVYRYRCVSKHGFRTGGGDGDKFIFFFRQRIFYKPKFSVLLLMLQFQIRKGCPAPHAPVDYALPLVNPALFLIMQKGGLNGFLVIGIHCKARPSPVAGSPYFF